LVAARSERGDQPLGFCRSVAHEDQRAHLGRAA
jgi:hypothetical protein